MGTFEEARGVTDQEARGVVEKTSRIVARECYPWRERDLAIL
jgi:hypothetical protein